MNRDLHSLETIFAQAIEIEAPDAREAFLDKACENDAELRREVDQLVVDYFRAGQFLEKPAAHIVASADEPISEGPGSIIGPYRLMERIGEGGMGLVFVAEQDHPVRRKVALKVIKPGMDTRPVVARFEAERQALALMDHPNIAKVFDGGETASGRPYFVMELVKGVPITEYCDHNEAPISERLELFLKVCHAVQHAHQKGIIHRDIKPSNVMIMSQDGTPVVKVIDFGVAKAVGQQLTDKTIYTQFAQLVGTPLYMSPEQAGHSGLDVDTRTDIYALGVLLYELLTGTTPFDKDRLREADYDEIRRIIREEEPPKPSTRISTLGQAASTLSGQRKSDPKRLSQLLRGELDWIVMKALEKDRNRRYETASSFAADVQRFLHDEPVLACPPSVTYRLGKFLRRNRGRLAVATGIFLAATVIAVSVGWNLRDRAEREEKSKHAEVVRLETVEGHVRESLKTARFLIGNNQLHAGRERLAEARAKLGNDQTALPEVAAEVQAVEIGLDRFQQFLDLINRAHQAETTPFLDAAAAEYTRAEYSLKLVRPPIAPGRRPAAAVPFLLQALALYGVLQRADWDATLEDGVLGDDQVEQLRRTLYEELLWLANDLVRRQEEHPSGQKLTEDAAARAARVYLTEAERARQPTQSLYALRAICQKAQGEEAAFQAELKRRDETAPSIALDYFFQGQAAYDAKQPAKGIEAFEAALQIEPTHYWSMMYLGYCLSASSQTPENLASAARVFTGCIMKRPDHHYAYLCRATVYSRLGRYKEAVADGSRAVALQPEDAGAWYHRGNWYSKLGDVDNAIADYSEAIKRNPQFGPAWNNRGGLYKNAGKLVKAFSDCSEAIKLDPTLAFGWLNRASVYREQGALDKAIADFSEGIKLDRSIAGAWYLRGVTYYDLREYKKAVDDFSEAIELDKSDPKLWYGRGNAYAELGELGKAMDDCTTAINLDPKNPSSWNNRGAVFAQQKKYSEAIADYTKALEADPKCAQAWFNRGNTHHFVNQLDKAMSDYSEAIRLDPKLAQARFHRALGYVQQNESEKAVADLSTFVELVPANHPLLAQAYSVRAQANARLAHFDEVRKDYQAILKIRPRDASVLNAIAWELATSPQPALRDPKEAVKLANRAVELAKNEANYWNTLGAAQYRAGEWKAAVAALDKAMELRQAEDAGDRLLLAMAHQKLGNAEQARKAFDQAVDWLQMNKESLAMNKALAEELARFRNEAEEVLELKKK
jgi:tetratricopeptide (TPR) repeat protein/serine/threonine protein kinase